MEIMELVRRSKVIAILRGVKGQSLLRFAQALYDGGLSMIEITFDQSRPDSWNETAQAIELIRSRFENKVWVGAGTVLTESQVDLAHSAGSRYIISPNVNPGVIQRTREKGMCAFPGAATATEVVAAHEYGANAVKIFPASALGAGYIKALRAPLSHIEMLAVGGINPDNAAQFLSAGAIGLGVGGSLTRRELIERGDFEAITRMAEQYVKAVNSNG